MTPKNDTEVFVKSVWDGSDEDFNSLNHPGYSTESNKSHHTGGWHAHREVWTESKTNSDEDGADRLNSTCWVKDIIQDVTKFDYNSMEIGRPPRILVLYGSLRPSSFSRKCGTSIGLVVPYDCSLQDSSCLVYCISIRTYTL